MQLSVMSDHASGVDNVHLYLKCSSHFRFTVTTHIFNIVDFNELPL